MADPFPILGSVAAIAQLVQICACLVLGTYTGVKSTSGLPVKDEELDFVVGELDRLCQLNKSDEPNLRQGNTSSGLLKLASRYHELNSGVLDILRRVRSQNPQSLS